MTIRVGYRVDDVEKLLDGCDDLPSELRGALKSDLLIAGRDVECAALRDASKLLGALQMRDLVLAPAGSPDKAAAAKKHFPHVAARANELGVLLLFAEVEAVDPDQSTRRRFAAADDDEKAVKAEATRFRLAERSARDAEALAAAEVVRADSEHSAEVAKTKRKDEISRLEESARDARNVRLHEAELTAHRRHEALEERRHAAALAAATRDLELLDVAAASAKRDVETHKIRAEVTAGEHDELVRFLGLLKKDAGVDTAGLLAASTPAAGETLSDVVQDRLRAAGLVLAGDLFGRARPAGERAGAT